MRRTARVRTMDGRCTLSQTRRIGARDRGVWRRRATAIRLPLRGLAIDRRGQSSGAGRQSLRSSLAGIGAALADVLRVACALATTTPDAARDVLSGAL